MLVHSVFFWLKPELSDEDRKAFRAGVETLATIGHASAVYVGTPAATAARPVVDRSFTVGLTVMLENVEKHDAYQEDPIHLEFVKQFSSYWDRVVVYDAS